MVRDRRHCRGAAHSYARRSSGGALPAPGALEASGLPDTEAASAACETAKEQRETLSARETAEAKSGTASAQTEPAQPDKIISRSLMLSSPTLGVIAKIDVAEAEDGVVTPVDYKRGRRPHVAQGAYEPAARRAVDSVATITDLLGIEGDAAAAYFRALLPIRYASEARAPRPH